MASPLTLDRAIEFMRETLKIDTDDVMNVINDQTPRQERLDVLNSILYSFYNYIPFQNIVLMATPVQERSKPSIDDIINEVIAGRGGLCFVKNIFFKILLETIGYNVSHVGALIKIPDTHIMTIANDVIKEGDTYLVEAGSGFPVFQAISLHFKLESPVYQNSFLTYKLVMCNRYKNGFPLIELWHKKDKTKNGLDEQNNRNDSWWRFLEFTVESKELNSFHDVMNDVYTCPDVTPFHNLITMNIYPNTRGISMSNFTVSIEDVESHKPMKETIDENNELTYKNVVEKYFPSLLPYVSEGLRNLKNVKRAVVSELTEM